MEFFSGLVFSGIILSLLFGAGYYFEKKISVNHFLLSCMFLSLAIIQADIYWFNIHKNTFPFFFKNISIPILYCFGPLLWFYFKKLIDGKVLVQRRDILHFLPGFISFLVFTISKVNSSLFLFLSQDLIYFFKEILPPLILLTYLLVLIRKHGKLWLNLYQEKKNIFYYLTIIFSLAFLATFFEAFNRVYIEDLLVSYFVFQITMGIIPISLVFMYLFSRRYPSFLSNLEEEIRKIKYEKSHLQSINVQNVLNDLENLMIQEEIFKEENLDLETLAKLLHLKPYQLTELLNSELGQGFHQYINSHRVRKAIKIMKENPSMPILRVAMEVGFNSKSSFYSAFRKITGKSPKNYKE